MNALAPLRVLVLVLGTACFTLPSVSFAAGRIEPPATVGATTPAPASTPTPSAAVPSDDAIEQPIDLAAAREAATAKRVAEPSAASYHAEAELAERAGDWSAASAAYQGELARLGKDDPSRARAQQGLARVREHARGVVADEGKSTHREQLDRAWGEPGGARKTASAKPIATSDRPPVDDRIVKKWYFWVTIAAIAASAAAVTGIAIKASRDDKPDALDRRAVFGVGAGVLRF